MPAEPMEADKIRDSMAFWLDATVTLVTIIHYNKLTADSLNNWNDAHVTDAEAIEVGENIEEFSDPDSSIDNWLDGVKLQYTYLMPKTDTLSASDRGKKLMYPMKKETFNRPQNLLLEI